MWRYEQSSERKLKAPLNSKNNILRMELIRNQKGYAYSIGVLDSGIKIYFNAPLMISIAATTLLLIAFSYGLHVFFSKSVCLYFPFLRDF